MHVLAFSCVVALATNSSRMLSNTRKSIQPNLLLTLSRKYVVCHSSVFIKRYILHQVEKIIFYSLFVENFFTNKCWILWSAFSVCIEMITNFILLLFTIVYHIKWFVDVNSSLDSRNNSHLAICMTTFNTLLNSVC